ncbi:hypothetical protein J4E08_07890 [Sagittula sp. NFXS13]|uniref:hypothetical protein n=1 Tax=Sagittula sp. NFXS13 TaxID=2819095 RepID=UPI0032DFAAEE
MKRLFATALGAAAILSLSASLALAEDMMDAETITAFVTGKTYEGINPESGEKVASVVYHADGTSTLWMAVEGSADEPGSYRIEGNTYCTRYLNFRENSENCFTLSPLDDGRAQAWYTDGRKALILAPIEMPDRFQ